VRAENGWAKRVHETDPLEIDVRVNVGCEHAAGRQRASTTDVAGIKVKSISHGEPRLVGRDINE
jgi:hypothetical protein